MNRGRLSTQLSVLFIVLNSAGLDISAHDGLCFMNIPLMHSRGPLFLL